MSVYQQFVNSSIKKQDRRQNQQIRNKELRQVTFQQRALNGSENMLHGLNPNLSSTKSSTPPTKQQYKQLAEAKHRLETRYRQQEEIMLQNKYCSQANCVRSDSRRKLSFNRVVSPNNRQQIINSNSCCGQLDSFFKTDDPVLLRWLQAMRFETELENPSSMQALTLATDQHSAGVIRIKEAQRDIQELRLESSLILDQIDYLIEDLPLEDYNKVEKYYIEFTSLYTKLLNQTSAKCNQNNNNKQVVCHQPNENLTIIGGTPRKSMAGVRITRPLDKLAAQIRTICIDYANLLFNYQENINIQIDNGQLESSLRRLKELFGKFTEISIRAECANIIWALQYDFSQSALNRLSSSASLQPVRPFESSSVQLPLKYALIALWELTMNDNYICRVLTEKWQTVESPDSRRSSPISGNPVAKRLDYSTKYDCSNNSNNPSGSVSSGDFNPNDKCHEYYKMYQICGDQQRLGDRSSTQNSVSGALSSALKSKQQSIKQVSTIELLIDIIISQPNKHERLDVANFVYVQSQHDKLIDLDEWDQSVSAAIYTSNQYKVAALRILNQLCVNEQAIKTILKCFSTPPPNQGQPVPENKIIRSIFECYQTSQEHIYQNETMLNTNKLRARKKLRQVQQQQQQVDEPIDEYSDYGSRQTNSIPTSATSFNTVENDEGDDLVVKEAIRLLVQLTNPFYQSNQAHDFYTLIGRFSIESLVKYLTNIIKSTAGREMLFLSLTALANISFITTEPMKLYGTNQVMMEMFRASRTRSKDLDLRDQAMTILANMVNKNLLDIVSNGGLTFLLSCLENCPTRMANYKQSMDRRDPLSGANDDGAAKRLNIENKPRDRKPIDFREDIPDGLECACDQEHFSSLSSSRISNDPFAFQETTSLCISRLTQEELATMERIHQKAVVAFSRMTVDPSTTRMVLKYGGIKRMIYMCKFSHMRNHSDSVLIACIVALRKIAKVIERETFTHYNALDLIDLELNQALEIYGAPKERQLLDCTNQHRLFASDV